MAQMKLKNIGKEAVHFRNSSEKFEVLEVIFVDAKGESHKTKFALEDLRQAANLRANQEVVVNSVSIAADQVKGELVR